MHSRKKERFRDIKTHFANSPLEIEEHVHRGNIRAVGPKSMTAIISVLSIPTNT